MTARHRLAVLTSHPIQYQAPLFRALARRPELDLTVFFGSDQGARAYRDPGFQTTVAWDVGADRIFWTPQAVDNAFFQRAAAALPPRATLRASHDIPPEHTVFLFCGKLTPVKRPLDVLEAWQRLEGRARSTLVYVGDG